MFLSRPLRFDGPANVEIVGPGRLDAEIVGTPKARVAILGGAAVIDTTEDRDPLHSPRFRLGAGAFLALPKVLRIFPDDFAEPYGEPDPENPKPGDRALRFSTPARSLADQMQLERVQLADAAVVAAGDELVAAPELGRELGWTNGVVWRTSAAHPWIVDAPGDGAVVGSIAGGVGESVARQGRPRRPRRRLRGPFRRRRRLFRQLRPPPDRRLEAHVPELLPGPPPHHVPPPLRSLVSARPPLRRPDQADARVRFGLCFR